MPEADSARIAFAGTPEFARIVLQGLLDVGARPVLVLTQPDRPAGRGRRVLPSPVKKLASDHQLPIAQPASLKNAADRQALLASEAQLLIVAAYGLILPRSVLAIPARGCINVHASLLPRWRGAAPIERAIMAGDRETGVTLMQMDAGLDTGAMIASSSCPITPTTTGVELESTLADRGAALLTMWLPALLAGASHAQVQDDPRATYAHKLTRADAEIDWRRTAADIALQVRALAGRLSAVARIDRDVIQILRATTAVVEKARPVAEIIRASADGIVVQCGTDLLLIHELRVTSRGKGAVLSAGAACNGYSELFAAGQTFKIDPADANVGNQPAGTDHGR